MSRETRYELIRVDISKLRYDPNNARKHDNRNIKEIKRSLEQFGQHRPFVVQKTTDIVLIGNGMLQAMRELNWKEADAYFVDDDDTTAMKRALADNRTSDLSIFDMEILKDIFQEFGPNPDVPGWSDKEIEGMFDLSDWAEEPNSGDDNQDKNIIVCPQCGHKFDIIDATSLSKNTRESVKNE